MKKILIANRGEIARRVIHTAHAMGIDTVAVYSEPDAQAVHVREATQAFALGGTTSAETYLRVDRLLEAGRATGADAVVHRAGRAARLGHLGHITLGMVQADARRRRDACAGCRTRWAG